jgi:hypothetical protein
VATIISFASRNFDNILELLKAFLFTVSLCKCASFSDGPQLHLPQIQKLAQQVVTAVYHPSIEHPSWLSAIQKLYLTAYWFSAFVSVLQTRRLRTNMTFVTRTKMGRILSSSAGLVAPGAIVPAPSGGGRRIGLLGRRPG